MRLLHRLIRGLLALTICLISVPQKLDSHGGDPDLIHACINDKGIVRIVGPNDDCAKSETARHWIRVREGDKPPRDRKVFGSKLASVELLDSTVRLADTKRRLANSKLLFTEPSRSVPLEVTELDDTSRPRFRNSVLSHSSFLRQCLWSLRP